MGFPQSSAVQATKNLQEFWRLFTEVESSGDIYESEVSALAVVVGANSDIARYNASFYNKDSDGLVSTSAFSVDKPLVGRIDALASKIYSGGDRARVLLTLEDLAPPAGFRPPLAGDDDLLELVRPLVDIQYFLSNPPTVVPPRSDKEHLFEQVPSVTSKEPVWYLVPFYGRRFAEVTCKNLGFVGSASVDVNIYGINFSNVIKDMSIADVGHQQILLDSLTLGVPALGDGISKSAAITNRSFDYLAVELDTAGAGFVDFNQVVTHISTSDKV